MPKRLPRPEPITFEEIRDTPSLRGFEEFLQLRPAEEAVQNLNEKVLQSRPNSDGPFVLVGRHASRSTVEHVLSIVSKMGQTVPLPLEFPDNPEIELTLTEPAAVSPATLPVSVNTEGSDSRPTVGPGPQPTLTGTFYLAEGLGSLFPVTRVRPLKGAQDALTSKEEAVYNVLWQTKDSTDLSAWSYSGLASHKKVRSDKRNVAKIVQRLVQKGFIKIAHQGGGARTQKTVYRVLDYSPVLQAQRQRGVSGVIKTGNGVFYALKINFPGPTTVGSGPEPTVGSEPRPTVDRSAQPTVDRSSPPNSLVHKTVVQGDSSSSEILISATDDFDDDARCQLIAACRQESPAVALEVIAYATRQKRADLERARARGKRIDNMVGLLLTAVAKMLEGSGLERLQEAMAREDKHTADARSRKDAATAEAIADCKLILADPGAPEEEKEEARQNLALLGAG